MAQSKAEILTPSQAVSKALEFVEEGVTGNFIPDALLSIRARHKFGANPSDRTFLESARVGGLEEAYASGGARFMGRILADHLDDPRKIYPLSGNARTRIELFDPNLIPH